MQNEILENDVLLDEYGNLKQKGYAKKLLLQYDRSMIQANPLRIKEWDYYLICDDHYGVALTMSDNSYMGLMSVSLLNFKTKTEQTKSCMNFMPMGKTQFPSTSLAGDIYYRDEKCLFSFKNDGKERNLYCYMKNFLGKKAISVEMHLFDEPEESMVIATPFKEEKHFYYNQKINGMRACGKVKIGTHVIHFNEAKTLAVLDWGRGVWPYQNTWYWGSGSGRVNGKIFGFNIGYGFGDTSMASENMLFYDGKAHKLEEVVFDIPFVNGKEDYLSQWQFTSSDKRFEMTFTPILDRKAYTSAGVVLSDQHQVFGYFNGKAVLDNGEVIELHDFLGFAEKVRNKW